MRKTILTILVLVFYQSLTAQDLKPFKVSDKWLEEIYELAPKEPTVPIDEKRNILVFSLCTGFEHWTIPHTEAVIKELGRKSGVFNVVSSDDIKVFERNQLKKYDAIILNNNCSIDPRRNIFLDVLDKDNSLKDSEREEKAKQLEQNLLEYVKKGGGLMVLHGAITMLNKSHEFSTLVGGSFDYHPKQQNIKVSLVDNTHPLVKAFKGKGFEHVDEPYMFKGAYSDLNFRPLLSMNLNQIEGIKGQTKDSIAYISWIKKYGNGRVFYSSPSHNPQSYGNPKLLRFLLDGMQYVAGDLQCDDSALK